MRLRSVLLRRAAPAALMFAALAQAACSAGSTPPQDGGAPSVREVSIPEIQGASHVSPLLGEEVETTGVVTAAAGESFYLQDPSGDGRSATSDAVLVAVGGASLPGREDRVRVRGTVEERVPGGSDTGNLSVTRLAASEVEVLQGDREFPSPVALGSAGRVPPQVEVIGDDELPVDLADPDQAAANEFDPASEGIDFYESLEAMRVRVPAPVAVSPTAVFGEGEGEIVTLVEGGAHIAPDGARTAAGGILLQPHPDNRGDHNPERVQIQTSPDLTPGALPAVAVGTSLADVTGVMSYAFGNYEVVATTSVEVESPASREPESSDLRGDGAHVTVATYNVLNLNPLPETEGRMDRLAGHIADRLGAPDVVALQEIQDENGTRGGESDPETDATATLRALADAVEAAGGPAYGFFDVAPEPNTSGGVPGGNIRNAYLFRTDRVDTVDVVSLTPEVLEDAGARDPGSFGVGARRPLAATFTFGDDTFTVINNHFSSRFGSTPIFGAVQPFVQAGEEEREAQSRAVNDYVDHLLAGDPDARIVVAGDLNTFEWTDDLAEMLPGGRGRGAALENLVLRVPAERRYSYVFEGNSQVLDHVFVSPSLADAAEVRILHLNSVVPEDEAASDHDPVVVRVPVP